MTRIPEGTRAEHLKNKSFKIGADVDIPAGGARRRAGDAGRTFQRLGPLPARRQAGVPLQPRGRPPLHGRRHGQARRPANTPSCVDFKYDGGGLGKGGTRHAQGGRQSRWPKASSSAPSLPHLGGRDARHRRGHRHAGQRGLPRAVQVHRYTEPRPHPALRRQAQRRRRGADPAGQSRSQCCRNRPIHHSKETQRREICNACGYFCS